jgi:hypothetical protein
MSSFGEMNKDNELIKIIKKIADNGWKSYDKIKKMNTLDGISFYYASIINAKFLKEIIDEKCKNDKDLNNLMYLIQEELRIKEILTDLIMDIDTNMLIFKKKEAKDYE